MDFEAAAGREWLQANGAGSYASGTVAGCPTRRAHDLLAPAPGFSSASSGIVALRETLWFGAAPFQLGCIQRADGSVRPDGSRYLLSCELVRGVPTWQYGFQGWRLQKQLWLEQGQRTTFVRYLLLEAGGACRFSIEPLTSGTEFAWAGSGLRLAGAELHLSRPGGFEEQPEQQSLMLRADGEAKLNAFSPGALLAAILPDQPLLLRISLEPEPAPFEGAWERDEAQAARFFGAPKGPVAVAGLRVLGSPAAPARQRPLSEPARDYDAADLEARLRFAGSEFVAVPAPGSHSSFLTTLIAGYPDVAPRVRDTLIALPGILLATKQYGAAKDVLRELAGRLKHGLLPDASADSALWFFQAVDRYIRAANDAPFISELFPALEEIVAWHQLGMRLGVGMDPADGLLASAQATTWMDSAAPPRTGKPVEANALWFNAICLMAAWARELQRDTEAYQELAGRISRSFRARFWNPTAGCLFDVVDGPNGEDARIRPNQIFAVSLPFAVLFGPQARAVLETVQAQLLTPYGLRSLAPADPSYLGSTDSPGAWHQGAVHPWLMGPFVDAHVRIHRDPEQAKQFLLPLLRHLGEPPGIGTISEIFDGDAPHQPRGCIAQAWSVGEVLRCWSALHQPPPDRPTTTGGHNGSH